MSLLSPLVLLATCADLLVLQLWIRHPTTGRDARLRGEGGSYNPATIEMLGGYAGAQQRALPYRDVQPEPNCNCPTLNDNCLRALGPARGWANPAPEGQEGPKMRSLLHVLEVMAYTGVGRTRARGSGRGRSPCGC